MLTIYSTKTCVYCKQVEKLFEMKGVEFTQVFIDDKPEIRQELYEKTGAMTVPITTDGSSFVVGYNPANLMSLIRNQ